MCPCIADNLVSKFENFQPAAGFVFTVCTFELFVSFMAIYVFITGLGGYVIATFTFLGISEAANLVSISGKIGKKTFQNWQTPCRGICSQYHRGKNYRIVRHFNYKIPLYTCQFNLVCDKGYCSNPRGIPGARIIDVIMHGEIVAYDGKNSPGEMFSRLCALHIFFIGEPSCYLSLRPVP